MKMAGKLVFIFSVMVSIIWMPRVGQEVNASASGGNQRTFADQGEFAVWARDGIAFVSSLEDASNGMKVMGGTGNGKFSPSAHYIRQQSFITVKRLYHAMKRDIPLENGVDSGKTEPRDTVDIEPDEGAEQLLEGIQWISSP